MAEIDEFKFAMKNTSNLRLYKRYSVLLKHFNDFTNNHIARMEFLNPHTVGISRVLIIHLQGIIFFM